MVSLTLDVWLQADDIGTEDKEVTFADEGEIRKAEDTPFGREIFEIGVQLPDGKKRIWTMNLTSQRAVVTKFGADTAKWVGKKVTLFTTEQNVRGEMKKVIYARMPK